MKRSGLDSASSWMVASACCFINMMMYGMTRLSGVLFVASVTRYHVNRQNASFPYTVANFMRNTSGPLVGYLGHKYGVRPVTTVGALIASIGVGTCFLAESVTVITCLWGVLFGLGFGLGNILLPIKINQNFERHRASASGLSFAGACLGSFILPPIVDILLETYGLSGTFLILSGFVLNCIPAALLLSKPKFGQPKSEKSPTSRSLDEKLCITSGKKYKLYTDDSLQHGSSKDFKISQISALPSGILTYDEKIKGLSTQTLLSTYSIRLSSPDPLNFEQILENSKGRRQVDQEALENSSITSSQNDKDSLCEKECVFNPDINKKHTYDCPYTLNRTSSDGSIKPNGHKNLAFVHSRSYTDLNVDYSYQRGTPISIIQQVDMEKHGIYISAEAPDNKSSLGVFSVIWDPIFLLIAITNALYCFSFVCMMTVIVDFARDIEVGMSNEKFILMSLSIGDLAGRIGLGWVTDSGYLSRSGFAALCFICQAATMVAIAFCYNFVTLVAMAGLFGLAEAGIIVIFPLIIAEFIDEDHQTVAISSSNFLAGPLCLTVAPLIGYFRDEIGSYSYIFFGLGIISLVCCIFWLMTPCILKCRKGDTHKI